MKINYSLYKDIIIYLLILYIISKRINNQRIVIKHHAFKRAMQRRIHPDLIEDCLQMGRIKKFGRNKIRFERKLKRKTIVCIGEENKEEIKIITIEKK
ncbi:MAG: hypothetical protein HON47_03800 [Candidatus Diapherotrites archaeon]|jgi:hypothetical protein|uniref:DUF4258 domain-containing protein n=1 Tax=Candidatus Iainarchaeum sp. TaxID=3101447 RepID=A0A8T5GFB7_9ARCH|nr:hypothetical protein [Candidatus Diapherotrites archaeon]MBT7241194.1 hypothetical protein [Candidatus Diapherotrites archaeon]